MYYKILAFLNFFVVRGRGLMNAIELNSMRMPQGKTAFDLCLAIKDQGVLCKPTHETIIRLTPPLVIDEDDLRRAASIIISCIQNFS